MTAVPFIVYFLLIAAAWYVIMRILPAVLSLLRRVGRGLAEGITRRGYVDKWFSFLPSSILKLKPYGALILIVVAGGGAAFVAGDQFFDVAERLRTENETMLRIDQRVHEWTQENRYDFLTPFYLTFTIVGDPLGLTLILLIGIGVSLVRRDWSLAIYLTLTPALGGLLNRWLKHLFGRERPDLILAISDAAHQSFPSGHTMGSVLVLGALAYGSLRLTTSWKWTSLWIAAAGISTLIIALSRIYVGVHWISDIAAGFAAGFAWLLTSIVVFEGYR
ncbi:MAG: phosphatase PAP2 family protein, partial [Acidobacteria bacterium]|nr:phosphatase PAP2 family protein [Acidobacteriota bacterium]